MRVSERMGGVGVRERAVGRRVSETALAKVPTAPPSQRSLPRSVVSLEASAPRWFSARPPRRPRGERRLRLPRFLMACLSP